MRTGILSFTNSLIIAEKNTFGEDKLPNDENHFTEGVNLITLADSCLSVLPVVFLSVCMLSVVHGWPWVFEVQ